MRSVGAKVYPKALIIMRLLKYIEERLLPFGKASLNSKDNSLFLHADIDSMIVDLLA